MQKPKFGLDDKVISMLRDVFAKHQKIARVLVYGSRAKGNYKPGSDIDLTIEAPDMDLSELLKIENDIDDLLLPYKVDLSLYHQIDDQEVLEHISRIGLEFFKK